MSFESPCDGAFDAVLDELEEALSRGVGDIAAHRLVATARKIASFGADAGGRLFEGLLEYALEEKHLLVARTELEVLEDAGNKLQQRLESLEQRLERLAGKR